MATSSSPMINNTSEPFILIWLNPSATVQGNLLTHFHEFLTHIKPFFDSKACEEYLKSSSDERFVLIVTGQIGQDLVPRIHQFQQILSIYIYCMDQKRHEKWSKEYKKVTHINRTKTRLSVVTSFRLKV